MIYLGSCNLINYVIGNVVLASFDLVKLISPIFCNMHIPLKTFGVLGSAPSGGTIILASSSGSYAQALLAS